MPGTPDWGGQTLQSGETVIFNQSNLFFNAGQTRTFTAPVSRPGYIVRLHLWHSSAGGGAMPVQITATWVDLSINAVMATQTYWVFAGDLNTHHILNGQGPAAGTQLQLAITNASTLAQNMLADIFMVETSGYYTSHEWRTDDSGGFVIPGFTTAESDSNAGILGALGLTSIPAGTNISLLLPLWTGPVWCTAGTAAKDTSAELDVLIEADASLALGAAPIVATPSDSSGHIQVQAWLPRVQCRVALLNNNAAAQMENYQLTVAR